MLQLFCSCISWFLFFCLTRTLSNSLECSLASITFFYWPDTSARSCSFNPSSAEHARYESARRTALILAALIFAIRPTHVRPLPTLSPLCTYSPRERGDKVAYLLLSYLSLPFRL